MRKFDYSFLENGLLPPKLLTLASAIGELKVLAQFRRESFTQLFTKLESVAKVQSVKNSNAIEGIVTSDERITAIVNQNSAPLNHDEAEIAGYRDALNLMHTHAVDLDLRERDILHLHEIMLSYSVVRGGNYKSADNVILEIDAQGRRKVRFAPVSAGETADAMEQLVLAFLEARGNANINPLLLIPCVILDFLCIHPFADGNGRISRLLSLLLLSKSGFDVMKYISFEEQINKGKGDYYEALRLSSVGWHTNENDYLPFVENFISTLLMCYKELDRRFAVVQSGKVSKKMRIEETVLKSLLPISKREICDILPDISPSTVELVLSQMLKANRIVKIGSTRSVKYVKK